MADYDRRPNFDRRPRGGRGRFNDRKRRYGDDDYDDRRNQRRRYEEPLSVTIRKSILSIAESPHRRVEDDVADLAAKLAENYFDSDITAIFLDLSLALTVEQPLKIPFIAAIVLLVNAKEPRFAEDVMRKIGPALQKYIDEGCWREVKLCLRFLGSLQGLFGGEGVFGLLEDLFQRAVELQTESSEDSLGLELVKIILFTIPYVMASSANGFEAQANALLEKTDIIASTPHTLEALVNPYTDEQAPTESALALLQRHMQEEAKNGWELACLPRPWKSTRATEEEDPLTAAQKHPFPELTVPEKVQVGPRSIFPEIYFSVYTEQDIETVPAATDPAALLIRDALTDTINVLDYNRHITARFLIDLDCYFAPNTFVKRATAFDKLRDLAGDRPTWKPEDVVVDAAFAQLFQLPAPEHKLVYYHSVLTEACKIAPAAVAPSLGRAIRYLYKNVERMDLELSGRFLDWFAHHLSNFGFTWKWTEWTDDVALSDIHPKKAFIHAALDKEIRLSFAQRIKGTIPEPYQPLISEAKEKDAPDFKFNDETTPFAAQGKELAQLIRRKATDEDFAPVIQAIEDAAVQSGISTPQLSSTDALVTAICWVGSKSLSHVLACVERCRDRLITIASSSPADMRQIITSVMAYWADQPGVGVNIVDKLLNYSILSPSSVVEWALVEKIERGTRLAVYWVYELVSSTTIKVAKRVRAVVTASRLPGLPEEQVEVLRRSLETEMANARALYATIEDALLPIAEGTQDQMMESSDALREEEGETMKTWAERYLRVFRRKLAVEESWVREELVKPIPVVPEEPPEVMQEVEQTGTAAVGNGTGEVNGNGNDDVDAEGDERGGKRMRIDEDMEKIE